MRRFSGSLVEIAHCLQVDQSDAAAALWSSLAMQGRVQWTRKLSDSNAVVGNDRPEAAASGRGREALIVVCRGILGVARQNRFRGRDGMRATTAAGLTTIIGSMAPRCRRVGGRVFPVR